MLPSRRLEGPPARSTVLPAEEGDDARCGGPWILSTGKKGICLNRSWRVQNGREGCDIPGFEPMIECRQRVPSQFVVTPIFDWITVYGGRWRKPHLHPGQ